MDELKSQDKDKLRNVLPRAYPDAALSGLLAQLNEAEQKKAALIIDYSVSNNVVTRVQTLIDTLNQQIDDCVAGIMVGITVCTLAGRNRPGRP